MQCQTILFFHRVITGYFTKKISNLSFQPRKQMALSELMLRYKLMHFDMEGKKEKVNQHKERIMRTSVSYKRQGGH